MNSQKVWFYMQLPSTQPYKDTRTRHSRLLCAAAMYPSGSFLPETLSTGLAKQDIMSSESCHAEAEHSRVTARREAGRVLTVDQGGGNLFFF